MSLTSNNQSCTVIHMNEQDRAKLKAYEEMIRKEKSRREYSKNYQRTRYNEDAAFRKYRQKSNDRSATKRWIRDATPQEVKELVGELGRKDIKVKIL